MSEPGDLYTVKDGDAYRTYRVPGKVWTRCRFCGWFFSLYFEGDYVYGGGNECLCSALREGLTVVKS